MTVCNRVKYATMMRDLHELIQTVRRNRSLYVANEQATKQGVVLPLLGRLGWDRDNIAEVVPEYSVGSGRVDYCLRQGDTAKVFVEVKRLGEPLDGHQQQLLRYAFEQGVTIAALTDGVRWWLYLPTQTGSWEQRRFFTVDLEEQVPDDVATYLRRFLEKSVVLDGSALRSAQQIHASRAKEREIRVAIPNAWREICEEPDSRLIELLSEKVEGRCGHKPDPDVLEEFIVSMAAPSNHNGGRSASSSPPPMRTTNQQRPASSEHWTFQKPISYTFLGKQNHITRFKDILLGLAITLHERDPAQYWSRVSELQSSRGRHFYTRDPDQLQEPREIGQTGIWVETCFSANDVKKRCHELLAAFGHPADSLCVELRPANT